MSNKPDVRARFDVLELAPTAFIAIDREWRCVYVNAEGARQLRRAAADVVGKVIWNEFPPLASSVFHDVLRRAMEDRESVRIEDSFGPEGLWLELVVYPIDIGLAVQFADITARKHQDSLLAHSERELARAQQMARVGSWSWNMLTDKVEWSEQTYRLLAFEDDFRPNASRMEEFIHPDDVARNWAAIRNTIENDVPYNLVLRMLPRDGTARICHVLGETERNDDGVAICLFGTLQDITERVGFERAAEEDRRDLRRALGMARMASWSLDVLTNQLSWSRDGYELLGLDPDTFELTAENELALWHPEDIERAKAHVADAMAHEDGYELHYRMLHADGDWRHFYTKAEIDRDEEGLPVRIVGSVRDRTDDVRVEEERLRLERQIQQAQKLESLGVLAGGIAHDFNNLLVGILGNASLALNEAPPNGTIPALLTDIERAAQRAAELTRQLLAYAGKGRFIVEPVSLSSLVEEMLTLVRSAMSRKAELHLDLARDLPAISADATQLRQIVMNLLTNASDALEDRPGTIALRTGLHHVDASYRATMLGGEPLEDGAFVFLEVSDTGVGMSPETVSRIFDPFFTTKFTGRGLGLAATRGIVQGHRGAIKVYSEEGKGTTFRLFFPAIDALPAKHLAPGLTPGWSGHGTVLVIDDEPAVRRVIRAILERMGFEVLEASDGAVGVEVFEQQRERINLTLLDLTMPKLDGEETFRQLRLIEPDVRVLLMSGYNAQNVTSQFVGKGLAGFVQKPFRADELEAQVLAVLDRR